jgi:hypothetical protein
MGAGAPPLTERIYAKISVVTAPALYRLFLRFNQVLLAGSLFAINSHSFNREGS